MDSTSLHVLPDTEDGHITLALSFGYDVTAKLMQTTKSAVKYVIRIINISRDATSTFREHRPSSDFNLFSIPTSDIRGKAGDEFDVEVDAHRVWPGGSADHLATVALQQPEKLLGNALLQNPDSGATQEHSCVVELQEHNAQRAILRLTYSLDPRIWPLLREMQLLYNTYITNTTTDTSVSLHSRELGSLKYELEVNCQNLSGDPADYFVVEIELRGQRKDEDTSKFITKAFIASQLLQHKSQRANLGSVEKRSVAQNLQKKAADELIVEDIHPEQIRLQLQLGMDTHNEIARAGVTDLRYHIHVHNQRTQQTVRFDHNRRRCLTNTFLLPPEQIPGRADDTFNIQVLGFNARSKATEPVMQICLPEPLQLLVRTQIQRNPDDQTGLVNPLQKLQLQPLQQSRGTLQQMREDTPRAPSFHQPKPVDAQRTPQTVSTVQKTDSEPSYGASIRVIVNDERDVTVVLRFNDETTQRLQREMSQTPLNNLLVNVKVTNLKTQETKSEKNETPATAVHQLALPFKIKLGHDYIVEVDAQKASLVSGDLRTFFNNRVLHQERFNLSELHSLYQKAIQYGQRQNRDTLPIRSAYRNKPRPYFENILLNRNGVMEVYSKDHNGDPGSAINGQIRGLFFGVRLDPRTRAIPAESLFGGTRIVLPIEKLIQPTTRLYFTDFYCHKIVHHLTLVAAESGSPIDAFCSENLLEVCLEDNPFFFRKFVPGSPDPGTFYCCSEPRVEILWTQDLDLKQSFIEWYQVPTVGRGCSTPGGLPKRPECEKCNLYPPQIYQPHSL